MQGSDSPSCLMLQTVGYAQPLRSHSAWAIALRSETDLDTFKRNLKTLIFQSQVINLYLKQDFLSIFFGLKGEIWQFSVISNAIIIKPHECGF
jgi:hypothetical protein